MKSMVPVVLQSYYDDWKMSPGLALEKRVVREEAVVEIRVAARNKQH